MKFCVENNLSIFEFHDSEFSFVSFDGKDLVVSVSMMNIHKDTPQNPSAYDMEIASAQIAFKNFNSATYEPGRAWKTDEDGKSYPVGPRVVFSGQDGINRILEELRNEITVYHFEKEDRGYSIGGCGIEPYFTMGFDFDSVVVCWDEYKKKAWYELHRQYRYDTVLHTPTGGEVVQLIVSCHEEPVYVKGVLEQPPTVNVGCKYDGKQYWGHGSDNLWIDAFADLQRHLPAGVLLTCCLTCRHGNLCPVGNDINEVFCTKDALITQKSDLYFYTEDNAERTKRSRQYCDLCPDYHPQTDGFYTYNDYLHFLNRT
ncbi:MAG: hypothetical protein E7466_03895 [Ruminococcaceae bacterium]|nr:hypothetical protein [Oscillospiraceae bacterium]